jgi:SAM-dependent methyltransferase
MNESRGRALARWARDTVRSLTRLPDLVRLAEQTEYLDREVSRLQAAHRRMLWQARRPSAQGAQTKASFDFQWQHMPAGRSLPSDPAFMQDLERQLLEMVREPKTWFAGKRVADIGCGLGRYSYGLLSMGAHVTACDQSEAALQRTATLCGPFADRLALKRIDLLEWSDVDAFDLAFCYGVVHHTGNTYLAMENVCRKVREGGRVFFMIYAPPQSLAALREVNEYEHIADEMRDLSFAERQARLEQRFGPDGAHGWFDATSPRINDRLSFEEIHDVLTELGFGRIQHMTVLRNHYVVADRLTPA